MGILAKRAASRAEAESPPVILLDANNVCHIALHSMGDLSFHDRKTGVIFGLFTRLLKLWEEFGTNRFVICWDSRKRFRSAIYPEYKGNRKASMTPEDRAIIYQQMEALRCEILPKFGFRNIFHQTGYEADDMIAAVVYNLNIPDDKIIVSTDKDLYQLLDTPGCRFIYNPITKKKIDGKEFRKIYGIKPINWVIAKSAMGDSGDNIPGIPGIGEKSALAWVKGELKGKKFDDLNGDRFKREFQRNWRLVSLPFLWDSHPIKFRSLEPDEFGEDQIVDTFDYYGFRSFLREETFAKWKEFVK